MNTENSKNSKLHVLLLKLTDKKVLLYQILALLYMEKHKKLVKQQQI